MGKLHPYQVIRLNQIFIFALYRVTDTLQTASRGSPQLHRLISYCIRNQLSQSFLALTIAFPFQELFSRYSTVLGIYFFIFFLIRLNKTINKSFNEIIYFFLNQLPNFSLSFNSSHSFLEVSLLIL